ncbi:MAG TPA: GTPase Era [Saprospiraceae bacterium]|nr:GTPase Era [Saprospiraceae bacterium]HPR00317.1 GTPase Era [Saprospiraceae bacterium]HRV84996.1 GTPase Era [Saprospiraceae bacterium]
METHRSGFVNIIGKPNVGKSTLMNALVDEKLSIITSKPQTTRHRILSILSGEDFQIVFSDTPGLVDDPNYGLHRMMNAFSLSSFDDADVMILVTDAYDSFQAEDPLIPLLRKLEVPKLLVVNKLDLVPQEKIQQVVNKWTEWVPFDAIHQISALEKTGVPELLENIKSLLPEGPVYYPKDQLSDRHDRFFVAEMIRGQILQLYSKEIPYACEVQIDAYEEGQDLDRIRAIIYVARRTQKAIVIGKDGTAIKKLGIAARQDIEAFLGKQVYLELYVKVREDWRDDEKSLRGFGYDSN